MSTPTAAERLLLDTEPQSTDLYLSIYEPNMALMCQMNGTYDQSTQKIDYDVTLSGSYGNIGSNLFLVALVGTTPGEDDLGRTWVRTASSTELRLVESDHVNWQDDCYITVLEYTEIIPVFPRIIQNPANEEDVIFYKWYDLAYTNQNTNLGSLINMGSDVADWMTAGTGTAYFTSSGTYNLVGSDLSYAWSFEGALTTGSTAAHPGNITWNQPGNYRVILTVTAANGATDTSVRYVSWYTPERPPIQNFTFGELSGSRDGVGYSARIRVREPIADSKVRDGMLAIIFKRDYYGATQQSINNSDLGRSHIFFVGYINGGEIQYNNRDGTVEFEVLSPTNLMEITECFGVSVESKANPTTWYELQNMTVGKALYHYYRWHSTVLFRHDLSLSNLDDRNIQYFDADRTSLYDAGNSVLDGALKARLISDRLGHLWAEREAAVIDDVSNTLPTALTIQKKDWMGTPSIDERHHQNVAFIEAGGIAFDGSASTALVADAPGLAPGYRGKVERFQGLALTDQDDLNQIAGGMYAWWNSKYPSVEMKLRGNFANLDIAPQELLAVNLAEGDTPRRITWNEKKFVVRGLSWAFHARRLVPTITLAEATQGFAADTVVIPIEPPEDGEGGGSATQPPVTVPPVPVPSPVAATITLYDEGVLKGQITGLNIVGGSVEALVSGTVGHIIHSDTGGGSTGTNSPYAGKALYSFVGDEGDTAGSVHIADSNFSARTIYYETGGDFFNATSTTIRFPAAGTYNVMVEVQPIIGATATEEALYQLYADVHNGSSNVAASYSYHNVTSTPASLTMNNTAFVSFLYQAAVAGSTLTMGYTFGVVGGAYSDMDWALDVFVSAYQI
jgi:hypothetical protein